MAFGIAEVLSVGMKIIDKFIPDPAQKAAAIQQLKAMDHAELMAGMDFDKTVVEGQNRVNEEQAKSSSIWVSGARPFFMWVCGTAFALHFVVIPLGNWIALFFGVTIPALSFDMSTLMTVTVGMLGLGGARTYEKIKGVAK